MTTRLVRLSTTTERVERATTGRPADPGPVFKDKVFFSGTSVLPSFEFLSLSLI
ncbi:hypothetical protein MNBD_ALPHA11-1211 [hydrothermal vent metagenome]|uniref:Uncharacterized protein n=1 Tax=hydrothermal vent metagenome TaxID=652676 RepID=A0A3B0TX23_9ZZZZ